MKMAGEGYDMFIGGKQDASFGPVVFFGFGGIYIEVFRDVKLLLCPAGRDEIMEKVKELKSYHILKGARGKQAGDIDAFVDMILRVSHLLARFPQIQGTGREPGADSRRRLRRDCAGCEDTYRIASEHYESLPDTARSWRSLSIFPPYPTRLPLI